MYTAELNARVRRTVIVDTMSEREAARSSAWLAKRCGRVPRWSSATCRSTNGRKRPAERPTGALLDWLTHHVHIREMIGESYRLKDSKRRRLG